MMSQSHCVGSSTGTGPSQSVQRADETVSNRLERYQIEKERTEYVIEEVAVVFVRVEAVVDVIVGGKARVEVAEVQLAVKGQKDVVCPYYDYESAF